MIDDQYSSSKSKSKQATRMLDQKEDDYSDDESKQNYNLPTGDHKKLGEALPMNLESNKDEDSYSDINSYTHKTSEKDKKQKVLGIHSSD